MKNHMRLAPIFIFPEENGRLPSALLMRRLGFKISDAVQPADAQDNQRSTPKHEDDASLQEQVKHPIK
jgi:hypothetical protein